MKRMEQYPYFVMVIGGVLHRCPASENGLPLLQYGALYWDPVPADEEEGFFEEATRLLPHAFRPETA